jgi:hypothetical protein
MPVLIGTDARTGTVTVRRLLLNLDLVLLALDLVVAEDHPQQKITGHAGHRHRNAALLGKNARQREVNANRRSA